MRKRPTLRRRPRDAFITRVEKSSLAQFPPREEEEQRELAWAEERVRLRPRRAEAPDEVPPPGGP